MKRDIEEIVNDLTEIIKENKRLGIEISKKYKRDDILKLVNFVLAKNPYYMFSNGMTVKEYSEYIKNVGITSKKFKTYIIEDLIEFIVMNKIRMEDQQPSFKMEDLTLDLMNKRIDNLEKVDKQLFIYSVALNIVLKATIMSLHNTKTIQENVKNLIDNFDYEMKYELPLDDFRGLSYEMHFDDEFQNNIRKMVRRIIG